VSAVRIFVQARMSSRRFPGKVLAPLAGRPLIAHVLERCGRAFGPQRVVLATSVDSSDDLLAAFAARHGHALFRGDLENVAKRFQQCLAAHPCEWFVRISGDSPLIDPELVVEVAARRGPQYDLITNVQPRTFPPGQSVEVVRAECFAGIDTAAWTAEEREHVTLALYRAPGRFRVRNVACREAAASRRSLAVDTREDLQAVEALIAAGSVPSFASAVEAPQ
jgi:spore coat polysaccharide biosynthesis protein SpsF